MSIEQRITSIERQLKIYKCVAAFFAALCLASVFSNEFIRGKDETNVVRANRFVLVSGDGKELGEWNADSSAPRLEMLSPDGTRGIFLSVSNDSHETTTMTVFGNGNFAALSALKRGVSPGGYGSLRIGNDNETANLSAGNNSAPVLNLQQAGQVRVQAVAQQGVSTIRVKLNDQEKKLELP